MRSGLRKVTKLVRGKKGAVRRSYWVADKQHKTSKIKAGEMVRKHGLGIAMLSFSQGFGAGVGAIGGMVGGAKVGHRYQLSKRYKIKSHLVGGMLGTFVGSATGHTIAKQSHRVKEAMGAFERGTDGAQIAYAGIGGFFKSIGGSAGLIAGGAAVRAAYKRRSNGIQVRSS